MSENKHDVIIIGSGAGGAAAAFGLVKAGRRVLLLEKGEHQALTKAFEGALHKAGMLGVSRYVGLAGTAHALGSLVTGADPNTSVVDADGRVHGMQGLFAADGSVLPRSSRVNPALTIYAWGLRLGDHLGRGA